LIDLPDLFDSVRDIEKLRVLQLGKKLPAFYENWRYFTMSFV